MRARSSCFVFFSITLSDFFFVVSPVFHHFDPSSGGILREGLRVFLFLFFI